MGEWVPGSVAEAEAWQEEMRRRVRVDRGLGCVPRVVAGVDVAYGGDDRVAGAVVAIELEGLATVGVSTATGLAPFPYVPGMLGFREVPVLMEALAKLDVVPDVLVCDGYGIAHPRRFGLACHLGVLTGIPTFGVAKTPYVGTHTTVGAERGEFADLVDDGEVVGRALRTQTDVRPVFCSPGHLIDLRTSTELTLRLSPRYRLPETTRRADRACRDALRQL